MLKVRGQDSSWGAGRDDADLVVSADSTFRPRPGQFGLDQLLGCVTQRGQQSLLAVPGLR